jgi:hypothetical protein
MPQALAPWKKSLDSGPIRRSNQGRRSRAVNSSAGMREEEAEEEVAQPTRELPQLVQLERVPAQVRQARCPR